jgi:Helix-hairpin-helix domain
MDREATDLRRIAGIGTSMERTLRESGVGTLGDLADRPTDELAEITGKSERTVREWQARARELAAGKEPGPIERDRQRSETFTVEVLLNEDDTVRYVRAEHVYTQADHAREDRAETTSWSDWRTAEQELTGFLEEHAGLAVHAPEPQPTAEEREAQPAELQAVPGEPTAPPGPVAPPGPIAAESPPAEHRIRQLAAMPSLPGPGGVIPSANTPFTLRLPVDLTRLRLAGAGRLEYQATVVAKRLGRPRRQVVGGATGAVDAEAGGRFDAVVRCEGLPAGTYRLEAALRLDGTDDHVVALLENAVLEVLPEPGRHHVPNRPTVVPLR